MEGIQSTAIVVLTEDANVVDHLGTVVRENGEQAAVLDHQLASLCLKQLSSDVELLGNRAQERVWAEAQVTQIRRILREGKRLLYFGKLQSATRFSTEGQRRLGDVRQQLLSPPTTTESR